MPQSAQMIMIKPDQGANKNSPVINGAPNYSNDTVTLRNHSNTTKNNSSRKETKLQSTQSNKQNSRDNKSQKVASSPFSYKKQGDFYAKLTSMPKGYTSVTMNKDEDEIQDVSSEVKSSYTGKDSQENSEFKDSLTVPSQRLPFDSSVSGYQGKSFQNIFGSADMQRLVDGRSDEIKIHNRPGIYQVGGPITSISAVGMPLSRPFRKATVSGNALKSNSSSMTIKAATHRIDNRISTKENTNGKNNILNSLKKAQTAQNVEVSTRLENKNFEMNKFLNNTKLGIQNKTDLNGKSSSKELLQNKQMLNVSLTSGVGKNASVNTNLLPNSVTLHKFLEPIKAQINTNDKSDRETKWNTISETGKLNFSLKFPFKKNTSIESADHLIQVNVSKLEQRKVIVEPLSESRGLNTRFPTLSKTERSNRRTSKVGEPLHHLNTAGKPLSRIENDEIFIFNVLYDLPSFMYSH